MINATTKICLAIGDPIKQSLGPLIYNDLYPQVGLDGEYVYLACRVKIEDLKNFTLGMKTLGIKGVSCTVPHKSEIMQYLDEIDEVAVKIGAVNSVVNNGGILKGYNTDWIGIEKPLRKHVDINNKNIAIIGAGGASRAAAYAVKKNRGNLYVYNRTLEKAEKVANDFGGTAKNLSEIDLSNIDVIINTTSVGMYPEVNKSPLPKEQINSKHIVFDAIHTPAQTQLLKDASSQGAKTISGREMFIYQGIEQFKLHTGVELSEELVRKQLEKITAKNAR